MTDPAPAGIEPLPGDRFAQLTGPLAGTTRMRLEVVENSPLSPGMQQVVLTAPGLAGFSYRPGQDIMLMVAVAGNGGAGTARPVRRRYTIRSLDHARRLLTLHIVRHPDGPGERWVQRARPGDTVEGIGPRGKIFPAPGADWHLFAGDDSALPAFFAMAGSLPPGTPATVIMEVPGPQDEQPLAAAADVTLSWLHRGNRPAGEAAALAAAAAAVPLPPGTGHVYLAGEASMVLALREVF
ncbi:MAG: siderophore-interacting protein, partial [Actinobacteria bacterium]|nr:siderophore-interacting protein [Actinomycetota bacterium]